MKAMAFDGISRDLGQSSTRRSFFRLLGGAAAVGVVATAGLGEQADARRRRRKKKKVKSQPQEQGAGVCQKGAQIAQLSVPYNGVPVLSPVLADGQVYTVQVSGAAATNGVHSVDAEYDFITATPNDLTKITDIAVGVDVGLSIDDGTTDGIKTPKWGPYNPNHTYSQQIVGKGRPISLLMQDSIYTDNSGSVTVTNTCG
jgi:hypothetical protein